MARPLGSSLGRISFLELSPLVLGRALEPFPEPVRTLDALHLASIEFLRGRRLDVRLATYDRRMTAAAQAMGILLSRCSERRLQSTRCSTKALLGGDGDVISDIYRERVVARGFGSGA